MSATLTATAPRATNIAAAVKPRIIRRVVSPSPAPDPFFRIALRDSMVARGGWYAARHAFVVPNVNYEVYGKALLDRDDQITPLI